MLWWVVSGLLTLAFWGCVIVVLLTQVVSWYEYANANPTLVYQRFSLGQLGQLFRCTLRETLVLFSLLPIWPIGFLPRPTPKMSKDTVPIILLHGLFQNQACWWWMRRQLKKQGYVTVSLNLSPWHNVEALAEILDKKIDRLRHRFGIQQVVLVGHSMGGMIARNYVQLRGGDTKVASVVQLGSPNNGSKLAPFAISPLGLLLLPGSDFLQRLAEAPMPQDCEITSIYSRRDNMVLPFEYSHLPDGRNIEIDGLGHTSLLFSRRVLQLVLQQCQGVDRCRPSA